MHWTGYRAPGDRRRNEDDHPWKQRTLGSRHVPKHDPSKVAEKRFQARFRFSVNGVGLKHLHSINLGGC